MASTYPLYGRAMGIAVMLAVLLVAYNSVLNLWPPFNGPAYVPFNTLLATTGVLVALLALDLTGEDLGFGFTLSGAAIGIAIAVSIGGVLLALASHDRTAPMIADRRVAHLEGRELLYQVCVRIPLGTALTEEILFRGVLLAAFEDASRSALEASIWSSIAFGLWHVSPTLNLVRINHPDAGARRTLMTIAGAVAFTFIAGLAFCWLRIETGNLAAPVVAHAGVNSLATIAAIRAARRSSTRSLVAEPAIGRQVTKGP